MKANKREIPIRKGSVYCAPFCGGACQHKAFTKATREARALAARLNKYFEPDERFEPHVFENLGWHYNVSSGVLHVSPDCRGSATAGYWTVVGYTAFFNSKQQVLGEAKTAEQAIIAALKKARDIAFHLRLHAKRIDGDVG